MTTTVYVASPYTIGDKLTNTLLSIQIGECLIEAGFLPYLPLLSHFWNEHRPHEYEYWIALDFEWVKKCDLFLRLPGISKGADAEEIHAIVCGKPIFHGLDELVHAREVGLI